MLTAIGDAVAGMGGDPEKMQRIITQLGQIKTTAKVSGEDLRVLAEAGVPAWRYLAEYAGKSVAEVQKLAQKNQLDAGAAVKVITAGMEHDFQGMMKATEGTYSSMWSTIEDLNQQRAAQAFKPAFDKVKEGQAAAIMGLQSGAAEGFAKGAADAQKVVLGGFDKMLSGIATGDFKRLGFGALESVVTGAKEGAKGLYDAGANAGAQLEQGWRDRMEQHSPSAVMEGLGFDAGASLLFGFLKGVQSKEILDRIEKAIQEAAKKFQLDPDLIRAAIKKESHFNPRAVSNKGAMGLTQLMPGTAERYGVKDPFNIEQNIMGGAHYLADLFKMFHEDVRLALAAYNAGEGRGIMKTPEARLNRLIETNKSGVGDYVDTIMRFFTRYQTGVDAPSAQSAAPRVAPPELAALTKERGQLNAETLDHIEALQLEQQRMARLSASLAKDMGKGPFSEAANSDLVKRREELEAAMNRNAQEMETYFLTQTKALNELDAKIAALKSRAASMPDSRDMGLAVDLPTGRAFDASQYLKPAIADAGKLTAGIHDATTSQYELLKAIAATGDAAEKGYGAAGQKVKALGDLINETQQGPVSGVDRYAKPTVTEDEEGDEVTTKATAGQQAAAGLHSALKDVQQMSKAAFGDFAQGIGSTVQQFVLLGSTGPHALRKVTAQTLASLSAEATVKALMALADGFVHLFTNPPQAAADFTAAAIYGGIAGVSAIAGRAVAGDIFKNEQQGEGAGASDGAGGSSDRTIREGRTGGASDPYVIERSRNAPAPQPIIIHLEAQAVTKNEPGTLTEHVLNIVSNDPRAQVAVVDHVERDLKMVDGRMQNAVTRGIRDMYQNRDDKITYVLEHAASRF
jgi:tape measure domain-containing protein